MSTPDSVQPAVLLPVIPRLSLAPSRTSRTTLSQSLARLPQALVATAGLVAILTVALICGRLLAVSLNYNFFIDPVPMATALGAVSFLSIVVVSSAIVLGHAALRATQDSGIRIRQAAAIVTGAAYLHLILWATRAIAAAFAVSNGGSSGLFLPNVFWWG